MYEYLRHIQVGASYAAKENHQSRVDQASNQILLIIVAKYIAARSRFSPDQCMKAWKSFRDGPSRQWRCASYYLLLQEKSRAKDQPDSQYSYLQRRYFALGQATLQAHP